MAAKTTSIELKGDRVQARSLAEAHVNRLLLDFRKNASFQSLPIYSQTKKFYDQTGAYVGTVYMQTVHNAESIVVHCGAGKKISEDELWMERTTPISEIVPVIRSDDNHWWIACLSGTFEPPYYAFENVGDAFTPEMMEDNVEVDLNNQLLSIGVVPLNGSDNLPELYFVAQTGTKPEEADVSLTDPNDTDVREVHLLNRTFIEEVAGYSFYRDVYQGTIARTSTWSPIIFGAGIAIPDSYDNYNYALNRPWVWSTEFGEPEFDVEEWFLLTFPRQEELVEVTTEGTISLWASTDPFVGDAIRIEQAVRSNYDLCYRSFIRTRTINQYSVPGADDYTISDVIANVYCDYFKIDGEEFPLREANSSLYPTFTSTALKYYGPDSVAKVTGLAVGKIRYETYYTYGYYYHGPNFDDTLSTTIFTENANSFEHTIPDVDGIDDTVKFRGQVFLGMIQYSKTEKVKLY